MPRILVVRHGLTEWNIDRRIQGVTDTELSDLGQRQAVALGRRMAGEYIGAIYSSPLKRAWHTACEVAKHHDLAPVPEPRLREISFGEWEGQSFPQLRAQNPELMANWFADPYSYTPPGAESMTDIVARLTSLLDELRQRPDEETIMLVTHGATTGVMVCLILGLSPGRRWNMRFDPTGVTEVGLYPDISVLNLLNDRHHLSPRLRHEDGRKIMV